MKRIIIIGGGASGMVAAIAAAKELNGSGIPTGLIEIQLLERNARAGKKLLATGNGRCNLSNIEVCADKYNNGCDGLVERILDKYGADKTLAFFGGMGLRCKTTHGGRIYPYAEQASAVLDVLRNELAHMGVVLTTDTRVMGITARGKGFRLRCEAPGGEEFRVCDKVIIATGGAAAPSTGSDGGGFKLLASLGHEITEITPALTQLKTDNKLTNSLKGIKVNAGLSAVAGGRILQSVVGEMIFTAYGLSGSAVFDISAALLSVCGGSGNGAAVRIDFIPELERGHVIGVLERRRNALAHLPFGDFLTGFINKRVGQAVCGLACRGKSDINRVADITDDMLRSLASVLKGLDLRVTGHTGWEHAQSSLGGVKGDGFYDTLESRLVRGLYAAGELFGPAGACGGYNLQWAWSSGIVAGTEAARALA